jgi:deoxyribodipyrimidine photo-lyase
MSEIKSVAIWWVKRDFRLLDNTALTEALQEHKIVIPLYVCEPIVTDGPDWGPFHCAAIMDGIRSLGSNLAHYDSKLIVRNASILEVFTEIVDILKHKGLTLSSVYSHEETGLGHTYKRDKEVAVWCSKRKINWLEFPTNGVVRGLKNRDQWQRIFVQSMQKPALPFPKSLSKSFPTGLKESFCDERESCLVTMTEKTGDRRTLTLVSERVALDTLNDFLTHRAVDYRGGISSMNKAPTACSRLSVQLAWGTLSLRTIIQASERRKDQLASLSTQTPALNKSNLPQWQRSIQQFQSRLYWHAHFVQKLEDEVEMEHEPVNPAFKNVVPYLDPIKDKIEFDRRLQAWNTGTTGFPAIDAAMRYYRKHGWLAFRSRAMITSFACHALRLPWQTMVYELSKLMHDYVPGIHVAQVQMQAGVTGINIIRVYSPQKQLEDHDPKCKFVKANVSELKDCTSEEILAHQKSPVLGSYRTPIVDFKAETKIMKDALYGLKNSASGSEQARAVYKKHGSRKRNNLGPNRKPKNTIGKKTSTKQSESSKRLSKSTEEKKDSPQLDLW